MSGDLVAGRMIAYRAWHACGWLHSLNHPCQWETATMTARCGAMRGPLAEALHTAPARGCTCGLYAYYRPHSSITVGCVDDVFGVVEVSGRVILATRGLKAERMRILGMVSDGGRVADAVARYDVATYPSREALLEDFPPQDYSGLVDVDPSDPPGFVTVSINVDVGPFLKAMKDAALSVAQAGESMRRVGIALRSSAEQDDPVVDVRARALELRKHRHTGPGAARLDGRRR